MNTPARTAKIFEGVATRPQMFRLFDRHNQQLRLSSGLGLGVTAFGGFEPMAANDDDPMPPPLSPALPVAITPAGRRGRRQNFYLDSDRGLGASWKAALVPTSRQSWSPTASRSRNDRRPPKGRHS